MDLVRSLVFLVMIVSLTKPVRADFVGSYAIGNFTLTNIAADGTAQSPDAGATLILTGGNTGSGISGITTFFINAVLPGTVSFAFSYQTEDDPNFDRAGYLLDGIFTVLADTNGESGSASFSVTSGEQFGFFVETDDNQFGPGILTVTDFTAPDRVTIPEPSSFVLLLLPAALLSARQLRKGGKAARWLVFLLSTVGVAQQTTYTGNNITGELQLVRTVNASQVAQASQLERALESPIALDQSGLATQNLFRALARLPTTDEYKPPHKLRRPGQSQPGKNKSASMDRLVTAATTTILNVSSDPGGFLGLTHYDQRNANNGNQFSVEPPNQSIAVSNRYILEGVNNAVQVYTTSGTPLLAKVISSNELFGLPPAIDRATGANGPFPTDMRVFFDQTMNRWFVLQRAQDYDLAGAPVDSSKLYMAVSQSDNPLGNYNIYIMDTTGAATPGCPCVFDYLQIGADQFGFYISANMYNTSTEQFVKATILAISKSSLAGGASLPSTFRFQLPFATGFEFAVQPATTPPGASYFVANGGLEYFASTRSTSAVNSELALWAMYNTSSLGTPNPGPVLISTVIPVLQYAFPDVAAQKPGPIPYGSSLGLPMAFIDGGDSRVQSLSYAGGRLYVTLDTQVQDDAGRFLVGTAYIIISTAFRSGVLNHSIARQGYFAVRSNHLLRSSIAVNAQGRGAITFTLVGPDYFPSAAFLPFDLLSNGSAIRIAASGVAPEDGFTGYEFGVARWGDYSTAVAGADGSIWMVTQFIPNAVRTTFANWGTWVSRFVP